MRLVIAPAVCVPRPISETMRLDRHPPSLPPPCPTQHGILCEYRPIVQTPAYFMPGPSNRTVRIPFVSNKHATIAKQVIDVDAELQKEAVKRTLTVEGDELIASVYVPLP